MANLDGGAAPGADADASSSTKDVFDPNALTFNLKNIDKIRSFMGIVSGCVAGILGITGILPGLVCFLSLHLLTHISMWAFKMKCDLRAFTRQSWFAYLMTNFQQCALSFMLFWTLFYGLVYLYD